MSVGGVREALKLLRPRHRSAGRTGWCLASVAVARLQFATRGEQVIRGNYRGASAWHAGLVAQLGVRATGLKIGRAIATPHSVQNRTGWDLLAYVLTRAQVLELNRHGCWQRWQRMRIGLVYVSEHLERWVSLGVHNSRNTVAIHSQARACDRFRPKSGWGMIEQVIVRCVLCNAVRVSKYLAGA